MGSRDFGRGLRLLAEGGASFSDTVLQLDPRARLFDSEASLSYKAMYKFTPSRGGGRPVNGTASGSLWAHAWCRDHERLDSLMSEPTSDELVNACAHIYTDLYDFAGLPELREVLKAFVAPTALLRAFHRVHLEPGLDLSPLARLEKPGQKLRALNMMSTAIRLPEAAIAVEASLSADHRVIDDYLILWAGAARMFLAAGATVEECVRLVSRTGSYRSALTVYENRNLPDEYWSLVT